MVAFSISADLFDYGQSIYTLKWTDMSLYSKCVKVSFEDAIDQLNTFAMVADKITADLSNLSQ